MTDWEMDQVHFLGQKQRQVQAFGGAPAIAMRRAGNGMPVLVDGAGEGITEEDEILDLVDEAPEVKNDIIPFELADK